MGRDLAHFTDLQKTLAQLGINNGSALLRLAYRDSQQPMEEAMASISQYFTSVEDPTPKTHSRGAHAGAPNELSSVPDVQSVLEPGSEPDPEITSHSPDVTDNAQDTNSVIANSIPVPAESTALTGAGELSIFAPPSSSTPAAALFTSYDETDYLPTIDHAKQHQARLSSESRNRKLLSDAELASQEQSRAETLSGVREVVVRLRFPDQSQVQRSFGQTATAKDLYQLCRDLMARPNTEGFSLRTFGQKGQPSLLGESGQQLIGGLGWQGRVLVTVVWAEDVSAEVRNGPSLKEEYRQRAEQLKVEAPQPEPESEPSTKTEQVSEKRKESSDGEAKEARMKRLLKGLTKK